MAFHDPITLTLFDKNDQIITPVLVPISIVQNLEAHDFNYMACQVDINDRSVRDEVLTRWERNEAIQYRISGRWGTDTGDINSVYAYAAGGAGEFSFYGRSHTEIMRHVLGFPEPTNGNPSTQKATHKLYTGSALAVVRNALTDNFVKRMGQKMRMQAGDLGEEIEIDFRFDSIYKHLYEDSGDRGGVNLKENGNIIFDITRDFARREYVLAAREPARHSNTLEVDSGLIERWQVTATRSEADRLIVGGPGEMLDRMFIERSGEEVSHRLYPAELFTENTSPETNVKEPTTAQLLEALGKWADSKVGEYAQKGTVNAQLIESEAFHLGDPIQLGDWVKIGVDREVSLGEQQLEKAVISWTREDGYSVQLGKPDDSESSDAAVLRRVIKTINDITTATRRR